ncbi:MAG: hypothetical protein GX620_04475 [Chloroflexi bacterium]|nr:hypothetical protein [Chloroflexota bacterium]
MTPKERFLAAVRREAPDVVPVAPLIHRRFAHRILAHSDWRAVFDVHRLIGSIHFRGPLGIGFEVEWDGGWGDDERLELGADGRVLRHRQLRTPFGALDSTYVYKVIPDDPLVGKLVVPPVKERADWDIYQAYLEEWTERASEPALDTVRTAYEAMGNEGVPSVGIGSVFGDIGLARGMEDLLIDLLDIPDRMEAVWCAGLARRQRLIEGFLASPSEVLFYDICWATGAMMSPRMFERWVLPDVRRAAELVHARPGRYIGLYTLGPIRRVLPMLVESGVDFVETFEPNQGDITLAEAKRLYGSRICLMGNFDCLVLARGSVEDARREARRCLDEGMEGGGYVMVTADEVPADARLENLRAMVETTEEYGRYD